MSCGRCSNWPLDKMVIFSSAEDRNALEVVEWMTKWKTLELGKSRGTILGKFRTPGAGSRACPLSLLSLLQRRARKFRKRLWMPQMLASDIQSRCFYFFLNVLSNMCLPQSTSHWSSGDRGHGETVCFKIQMTKIVQIG